MNKPVLSSDEIVRKVEETPFHILESEKGYCIVIGKYRLTDWYKTQAEAYEDAEKITWNRIIQVIAVLTQKFEEDEQ